MAPLSPSLDKVQRGAPLSGEAEIREVSYIVTNRACIEKMRTRRTKWDDPDDPNNELCKKKLDLALSCAFTVEVLPPPRVTVVKKEMNLALSCVFTVEVLPPVHSASIFTM